MLSLSLFEKDPEQAKRRLEGVARELADYLRASPFEEDAIINKSAYNAIAARPDLIERFPDYLAILFGDYDNFAIFSVVRPTVAPTNVVAAYMITQAKYDSINPAAIEGRLLPVASSSTPVFMNDASLCTQDVMAELSDIRAQFAQVRDDITRRMKAVIAAQRGDIALMTREMSAAVAETKAAQNNRHFLNSAFTHHAVTVQLFAEEPWYKDTLQVLTRVSQGIFYSMLSRDKPPSPEIYTRMEVRRSYILPQDFDALRALVENNPDTLAFMGGASFHNTVGLRWMLMDTNAEELLNYSEGVDRYLANMLEKAPVESRPKLTAVYVEMFPRHFVFNLAGRGLLAGRDIPVKRALFDAIVNYFSLPRNVVTAVDIIRNWWTTRTASFFATELSREVLQLASNASRYTNAVDGLQGTDRRRVYEIDLVKNELFQKTFVPLFTKVESVRVGKTLTFVSPRVLGDYLRQLGDYNARQQETFFGIIETTLESLSEAMIGKSVAVTALITDVRAFIALLRRHALTADVLLGAEGNVIDINSVSTTDSLLVLIGTSQAVSKNVFLPLGQIIKVMPSAIDALYNYYSRIHLYYASKYGTLDTLPVSNSYTTLLRGMRDSQSRLLTLAEAFRADISVDWNEADFDEAINALLSARNAIRLDNITFTLQQKSMNLPFLKETIGSMLQILPSLFDIYQTNAQPDTPEYAVGLASKIMYLLDTFMGGIVAHNGSVVLENAAVYKHNGIEYLSLYMVCLVVYVDLMRENTAYPATKTFDIWRYLVDYFDSFLVPQLQEERIEGRVYEVYQPVPVPSVVGALPELLIPPGTPTTATQRIIQFTREDTTSLMQKLAPAPHLFAALKAALFYRLEYDEQVLLHNWLSPLHLQVPCIRKSPRPWIRAKAAMMEMDNYDIAIGVYYDWSRRDTPRVVVSTLSNVHPTREAFNMYKRLSESKEPGSEIWRVLDRSIGKCMGFVKYYTTTAEWVRNIIDELAKRGTRPGEAKGSWTRSPLDYDEFTLVYRFFATSQFECAEVAARATLYPSLMAMHTKNYLGFVAQRLMGPRIADTPVSTADMVAVFRPFTQVDDALSVAIRALLDDTSLAPHDLLSICFFAILARAYKDASTMLTNIITLTVFNPTDIATTEQRLRYIAKQVPPAYHPQLLNIAQMMFGATVERQAAFEDCVNKLTDNVLSIPYPTVPDLHDVEVSNQMVDTAFETIFAVYHSVVRRVESAAPLRAPTVIENINRLFDAHIIRATDKDRRHLIAVAAAVRNYPSATRDTTASIPFFEILTVENMQKTFGRPWETRMREICDAIITVVNYTFYFESLQRYNVHEFLKRTATLRIPMAAILNGIVNLNNVDAGCIYDALFSKPDPTVDPKWVPGEINPEELIVFKVAAANDISCASLLMWEYAFTPQTLVCVAYSLRFYATFVDHRYDDAFVRMSMRLLRTNLKEWQPLYDKMFAGFATEGNFLAQLHLRLQATNDFVAALERRHPLVIFWRMFLLKYAAKLLSWETRQEAFVELKEHRVMTISTGYILGLEMRGVDGLLQRTAVFVLREIMKYGTDAQPDTYHRTVINNNAIMLNNGIHRRLAEIAAAK